MSRTAPPPAVGPEHPHTLAVLGYASRDRAMRVGAFLGASGTTLVRDRLSDPWPGDGGAAHVVRAALAAGLHTAAVSWVGGDDEGRAWTRGLELAGADVSGVAVRGTRTPSAYLFYPDDDATICVYDPGDCHDGGLTDAQRRLLTTARWCVVTAAPAPAIAAALDALPSGVRLAWAVKNDPDAFPPGLARRLAGRAALVTYSAGERSFLADVLGGSVPSGDRLVVETRGAEGAAWWSGDAHGTVPAGPAAGNIRPGDTTGAGDTLIAATVAALAAGREGARAVAEGVAAAGRHIAANAQQEGTR